MRQGPTRGRDGVWGAFSLGLVPWAEAFGALVHVVGDCLTREGCLRRV